MSEYLLIAYPVLLLGFLFLAARWQPRDTRLAPEERRDDDRR
jgi:hypothetical protein